MPSLRALSAQMTSSWHEGGLFVGMHWIWWLIWILTIAVLLWAMLKVSRDRSTWHRRVEREEAAEEELRRRFARGEIDEDEYVRRLEVLRETFERR